MRAAPSPVRALQLLQLLLQAPAPVWSGSTGVLLNEVLPNPDAAGEGEWAELYNAGTATADLSGWVVSDNRGAASRRRDCPFADALSPSRRPAGGAAE